MDEGRSLNFVGKEEFEIAFDDDVVDLDRDLGDGLQIETVYPLVDDVLDVGIFEVQLQHVLHFLMVQLASTITPSYIYLSRIEIESESSVLLQLSISIDRIRFTFCRQFWLRLRLLSSFICTASQFSFFWKSIFKL